MSRLEINVMKTRERYLTISHDFIRDRRLSCKSKGLLALLLSFNSGWDVSFKTLAKFSNDTIHSVKQGCAELQECGYLEINGQRNERGMINEWVWIVHEETKKPPEAGIQLVDENQSESPEAGIPQVVTPHVVKPETGYSTLIRNNLVRNNLVKKTPLTPQGGSERFDELWVTWPKSPHKKAKAAVKRHWERRKLDKFADEIICAVKRMAATPDWQKQGGQYIPTPLRFLNEERWKDEIEVAATQSNSEGLSRYARYEDLFPEEAS